MIHVNHVEFTRGQPQVLTHHCFYGTFDAMQIVVRGEKAVAFPWCQQHSLTGAAAKSSKTRMQT